MDTFTLDGGFFESLILFLEAFQHGVQTLKVSYNLASSFCLVFFLAVIKYYYLCQKRKFHTIWTYQMEGIDFHCIFILEEYKK
jgi:hypothetical protein